MLYGCETWSLTLREEHRLSRDVFGGLVVSMLASGTRVRGFKPVGFFGQVGSERICPMSQLCGM
jgi:hypothetical protein